MLKRCLLLLVGLLAIPACAAQRQQWALMPVPDTARVYAEVDDLVVNGMPMRFRAFHSPEGLTEVLRWFRRELGEPLVENRVGRTVVLGRSVGDRYLTVQLEVERDGSVRGVTALGDLLAAQSNARAPRRRVDAWLPRMPTGTRVLSDVTSRDGDKVGWHVVMEYDAAVDPDAYLESLLGDEGLVLEHRKRAAEAPGGGDFHDAAATLYFRGQGREAMATVAPRPGGGRVVVVNVVTTDGGGK